MSEANKIAQRFSRAAPHYESSALLQRAVLGELIDMLAPYVPAHARVLDAGCGPGTSAKLITRQGYDWRITGLDIAEGMARQASHQYANTIVANLTQLPFMARGFDAVLCSMVLQWVDDVGCTFVQLNECLANNSPLAFSVVLPGCLDELLRASDEAGAGLHINNFRALPFYSEALSRAGFEEIISDIHHMNITYPSVFGLLQSLKQIGANEGIGRRNSGLKSRHFVERLEMAYPRQSDGTICASWQIGYILARKTG